MFDAAAMGARIRALRMRRKLTQMELADALNLSVSFVGHLERGSRVASLETLICLSKVLEVTTDYLLLGDENVRLSIEQIGFLRDIRRALDENKWFENLLDDGTV